MPVFAAEAPNEFFFPGDINEFYWGLAAFIIVFGLLGWKLVPIARKALSDKADRIADELAAAERAQAEADAEAQAKLAKLGDAEADADAIVADARTAAATIESDGRARADADAAALKERVSAEIEASKATATAELRAELSRKAIVAAEAVVAENLDPASQNELIEQYIAAVGGRS